MAPATSDVLIVGNGILALTLADQLTRRQPELRVVVIGPRARPGGASQAAGAMLGCFGEITKDALATEAGCEKFAIGLAAHARWPAVLEELEETARDAGELLHSVMGTHVVLNGRSGYLDSLNAAAMLAALDRYGEPYVEVDPGGIPGLNPVPDARPLRAILLPNEGAVDANQILRLLEGRVRGRGVSLCEGEVVELLVGSGRVTSARLADGSTLSGKTLVVAAGATTARILRSVLPYERVLPVFAGAGVAFVGRRVLGEPFRTVVRSPNRSGSCGLHLIPLTDGLEYVGATNVIFAEPEDRTYIGVGHFLAGCAMEQLDQRIFLHRVEEWRIGNRPVTLDGFPVIGWSELPGLYVLSGTYRDGFHCSPVLAEHAADQVLGGDGTLGSTFSPMRRPIKVRSVEESVKEFLLHNTSGWYESGLRLPPHVSTSDLAPLFERQVWSLYDRLPTDLGLGPDILMFLLASRKDPRDVDAVARYLRAVGPSRCQG